jgi:hypothetical protein
MGPNRYAGMTISGEGTAESRSLIVLAKDVMEGYLLMNPLVLKRYDPHTCKELYRHLRKLQTTVRMQGIDTANQEALRLRNHRLQRLNQALAVIDHFAKVNKIQLS